MHARDIFTPGKPTVSFEFFPPKTSEAQENLFATILDLETIQPAFVSVTYGAGGSTRELTHDLVLRLKKQTSLNPVPHLTCVGHTEAEIHAILERYAAAGVSNILALRGDPPRDQSDYDHSLDTFPQAADLVRFIKKFTGHPDPRGFGIGVAGFPEGHPSTPNRLLEMDYLS
jgi:methylenetetrahydrofolate reductase (NADPH)